MIKASEVLDKQLSKRLECLAEGDRDYWSFKSNSKREHGHGFFQYPAMMVPQMARSVLQEACAVHPEIECVGDPFVGAGTVLTESMLRGLDFVGNDINPLAILLCRTKSGPFFTEAMVDKIQELASRIRNDRKFRVEIDFPGLNKWFRADAQVALSKIRRSIIAEPALWARRFFWIALAETVRFTSNSRTSTFKLHTRCTDEIKKRNLSAVVLFGKVLSRNLENLKSQANYLKEQGYLGRGHYIGDIKTILGDTRQIYHDQQHVCDIILTSPPYGDNATTVPYGQYSYLPLQWIDLSDIDQSADAKCICSTHEIDTRSLGGSKQLNICDKEILSDRSPSFRRYLSRINDQPVDRAKRVTAFFRDLDGCLSSILGSLRPGGLMVWTLGNRKVGGKRVPLDKILVELLSTYKVKLLVTLKRHISSKRMALKNSIADTMSSETILVMRKVV